MSGSYNKTLWRSRKGIFLQIVIVLIPSAIFINSGKLLLSGLALSVFLSWICLRLQKQSWPDVGLHKPINTGNLWLLVALSTLVLIPLSFFLRQFLTVIIDKPANLEAFRALKGNPTALLVGLAVTWIFGAFGEELFFRGFLLNNICKILPDKYFSYRLKWGISLIITSVLVGFGHTYQGVTGMIVTGFMGFCFGLIFLLNKKNLWANIMTHGIYDTIAFVLVFSGIHLDKLIKL